MGGTRARVGSATRVQTAPRRQGSRLRIQRLTIEPLTSQSFKPFGVLWDVPRRPASRRTLTYDNGFEAMGKAVIGLIWQPYAGLRFAQLERHFNVTQGFIPISGALAVVAVAAPTDPDDPEAVPAPDQVRAFLIDGTVGFRYKVGTWHSLERFVLHPPGATFAIVNVEPNPTQVVDYREEAGVIFEVAL